MRGRQKSKVHKTNAASRPLVTVRVKTKTSFLSLLCYCPLITLVRQGYTKGPEIGKLACPSRKSNQPRHAFGYGTNARHK